MLCADLSAQRLSPQHPGLGSRRRRAWEIHVASRGRPGGNFFSQSAKIFVDAVVKEPEIVIWPFERTMAGTVV
jgi:hypothetical protein